MWSALISFVFGLFGFARKEDIEKKYVKAVKENVELRAEIARLNKAKEYEKKKQIRKEKLNNAETEEERTEVLAGRHNND